MHTIDIIENNSRHFIPEKLSECDPKQLAAVSYFLYLYQNGKLTYQEFQSNCIYALMNMTKSQKELSQEDIDHIDENIFRLTQLLDTFFTKDEQGKNHLIQDFQQNPIPYIPTPYHNFKGPKDIFYTTFGEYVNALDAFGSYHRTQDIDILYDLAATFYRPHIFGQKLSKKEKWHHLYKKQLKKTYFGYIYAFYIFFSSFQDRLANQIILWEGQEIDFSILFKPEKDTIPSKINGLGMKSHAYVLAESGAFGDLQKVNNTPTIEIILRMYDLKKRDLDHKAYMKQQQNKKP